MLIIIFTYSDSFSQNGGRHWEIPSNIGIINSIADDFAPHFNANQGMLYFNSDRSGKSHFYYVNISSANEFSEVKFLKSEINPLENNQSYISCPSGDEAYFSTYRTSEKQSYLNIFKSIFHKNNWTEPIAVDSLICDAFCSHVTVSPDGNVMVFASTKNSKFNDIDLWMTYKNDNGSWSSPIAIDELNSHGNEVTPFLLSADTLYFSSDGYEGPGAFDVYVSTRRNKTWNRPKPLFDINSEFNESDFTIMPDGKAVFASDRPGGLGNLDLYIAYPLMFANESSDVRSSDISIRTQVSNIIAEEHSIVARYPAFHFFVNQSFDLSKNTYYHIIDSLLFEYPIAISNFLLDNPNEILVVDSSSFNNKISSFFSSKGISKNRLIFQKGVFRQDVVKFKLLSGNPLPVIELSENTYSYKPPVIEVSIDSRDEINTGQHSLALVTNKSKHEIELNDNKLPLLDIISLEEFDSEVFESDTIIINYKISTEKQTIADAKRVLFVSHQKIKDAKIIENNNISYEEYFLVLPDNIFFESDYLSGEYLDLIKSSISTSKSVNIVYYNEPSKSQASKMKDLLSTVLPKSKQDISIEKRTYTENAFFSRDLSSILLQIQIIK